MVSHSPGDGLKFNRLHAMNAKATADSQNNRNTLYIEGRVIIYNYFMTFRATVKTVSRGAVDDRFNITRGRKGEGDRGSGRP